MGTTKTKPLYIQKHAQILDITGMYVDIDKPDNSKHHFSGESEYSTFEMRNEKEIIPVNVLSPLTLRVHVICYTRKDMISEKIQSLLHRKGVTEIVLYTTDMSYLVPYKLLVLNHTR